MDWTPNISDHDMNIPDDWCCGCPGNRILPIVFTASGHDWCLPEFVIGLAYLVVSVQNFYDPLCLRELINKIPLVSGDRGAPNRGRRGRARVYLIDYISIYLSIEMSLLFNSLEMPLATQSKPQSLRAIGLIWQWSASWPGSEVLCHESSFVLQVVW